MKAKDIGTKSANELFSAIKFVKKMLQKITSLKSQLNLEIKKQAYLKVVSF